MIIQNMFEEDINRQINGVIKVDQDELGVIEQEVVFHCDQTMQPAAFGIRRRKTGNSVLE